MTLDDYLEGFDAFSHALAFSGQADDPGRILGRTRLIWKTRRSVIVSTVFVPWADGEVVPQWETLVLGDHHLLPRPLNTIGDLGGKYMTRDDGKIGHHAWCRLVAGWLNHAGRHTVTWQEMTTW